jgi:HPt (histidine-containing phosphotransfer) domain-containing protein
MAAYAHVSEPVLAREIFDRLRQATANNPEMLTELCRDYVSEARVALAQIGEALAQLNAGRLRERAHYLKGSSMMIGARELSQCCATLEQMGRDSELATGEAELARAVAALKTVEAELSQEFGPVVLPEQGSAA